MNKNIYIFPLISMNIFILPMLCLSSSNFFFYWLMIELSMYNFIFIMTLNNEKFNYMLIYLIIQLMSSILILLIFINFNELFKSKYEILFISFLNVILFMKSGVIPFHSWFLIMMFNLNWMSCLILSTLQKIPVFILFTYISVSITSIYLNLFSATMSAILSSKSINMKQILSFSSINQSNWLIFTLVFYKSLFLFFMLFYVMLSFLIFFFMHIHKINMISDTMKKMFFSTFYNYKNNLFIWLLIMSITSFPPFTGFLIKWSIIMSSIFNSIKLFCFLMILTSIMMIYFYFKISFIYFIKFMNLNINLFMYPFKNFMKIYSLKWIMILNLTLSFPLTFFINKIFNKNNLF